MKRILFVAHEDELGGATKSMLTIIESLKKKDREYHVTVLLRNKKTPLTQRLDSLGIDYICFNVPWIRGAGSKLKLISSLIINVISSIYLVAFKKVNSSKFDIVHSNSSVVGIGFFIGVVGKIKHVWHFREFGDLDFELRYPLKEKFIFNFFSRNTAKFIMISNELSSHYKFVPQDKKTVIHNGFDVDFYLKVFSDKGNRRDFNKINAMISGSFSRGKKQDTAINAIKYLKEQGYDIKLHIAGKGDLLYESELKKLVTDLGLDSEVLFLGYVNNIEKLRREMDFELVCSRAEAFGRVTVEAMLSKVVVIASDKGANQELVTNGTTGMIYKYDDPKSLANSIINCNNKEKYTMICDNSFEYATSNFRKETVVVNLIKVYNFIL